MLLCCGGARWDQVRGGTEDEGAVFEELEGLFS
jgi:hypothetical protein